jgi:putative mRNA 3-end processing factor
MKIIPLGGGGEVGRSAILVISKEGNVLFDYGVKLQGLEKPMYPHNPFSVVDKIDLILISHGHLDHVGYLPSLYKENLKTPWYATPATFDIADILWKDSIKLAKIKGIEEHFTNKNVDKAKLQWHPALLRSYMRHGMFKFAFYDAGHILGSASIAIYLEGKRVVYTGDLGYRSLLHDPFENFGKCDILIIEGTYATVDHPSIEESKKMLLEKVKETIDNKGNVLLPAFAVGRSQELIKVLFDYDKNLPIYLDGMSKDVTRVYLKYPSYIKDFETFSSYCDKVYFVETIKDRKKALKEPSIIITTAGMMDGGPALHYALSLNEKSSIILTGFQIPGSNGYKLLNEGKIIIDNQEIRINTPTYYIDMSAHIGKTQIIKAIEMANPEKVFFCHSEKDKANELINELKDKGVKAYCLENLKEVEL